MEQEQIILTGTTVAVLVGQISKAVREELVAHQTPPPPSNEDLLTRQEAAHLLRITLPTLRQHTRDGKLKGYRIGARVLYKRSEVVEALEQMRSRKAV